MKKLILLSSLMLAATIIRAQNGLEGIIVENYYVSDAADSLESDGISANPGTLPVGSKTYRVYVDLLQGYKFEAAYGINNPVHEFMISTTASSFYNNEDRGATTANGVNNNYVDDNTVMLDSWLSVGAASSTKSGILKDLDDGVATVVNNSGVLQNNDTWAGIPLTQQDGLIDVFAPYPVTMVGITNEVLVFDASNNTGDNLFTTINGSLACLTGSYGPDTVDNKVLIAQITTSGAVCFKLNIQIGTPTGGVENYVAENPVGSEIQIPSLMWCSTVGVNEIESTASSFKIFSNPSKDAVIMQINPTKEVNKSSYAIYDMTGRLLYTKNLGKISNTRTESIDISSLSKGQYLVELTLDGIASAKKIIKN
ncbi:MAG: T9SS type A sorting domain-containing protein [Bacteroidota bacterium]